MNHAIQHDNVHHMIPIRIATKRTVQDMMEMRNIAASAIRDSQMKYKDLAKKTHLWPQTISNLASGTTREPRASTCLAVLLALGYEITISKG